MVVSQAMHFAAVLNVGIPLVAVLVPTHTLEIGRLLIWDQALLL